MGLAGRPSLAWLALLLLFAAAAWVVAGAKWMQPPAVPAPGADPERATAAAALGGDATTSPAAAALANRSEVTAAAGGPGGTEPTADLRVLVRLDDGAALADRGVLVVEPRAGRAARVRRATTDAEGVAVFAALPPLRHSVRVIGASAQEVRLEPGVTATVTFTLARGTGIEGRVVDASGAPVAGAEICSMPGRDLLPEQAATVARSRADGSFRIDGPVLPVRQWIAARAAGHVASPWRFVQAAEPAAARGIVLRLGDGGGGGSLSGSCTLPDGTPAAGAAVAIELLGAAEEREGDVLLWSGQHHEATADAAGGFRFDDLAKGRWSVSARRDGLWFEPREVEVAAGAASTVQLVAETAADLAGVVVDEAGTAVAGGFVRVRAIAAARAFCGSDGAFALHDLPPRPCTLLAFADGCEDAEHALELHAGANVARLVVLRSATLAGVARTPGGEPLRGWRVGAVAVEGGDGEPAESEAATDADGAFAIAVAGLAPRRLWIARPESPFGTVLGDLGPFTPGAGSIDLVVPDGAQAAGALVGTLPPSGGAVRFALAVRNASVQRPARFGNCALDAAGRFRVGPLPAGSWWLLVTASEAPAQAGAAPVAGAMVFGPWQLQPGQVLDVGRLPVPQPGQLEVALARGAACEPAEVKLEWNAVGGASWGLLPIGPSLAGSWPMLAGEYELTIWGERFVPVARRVTVPAGGAARIDAVLEAGQRLPLELRLPDGETGARFVVRDLAGRVAYDGELAAAEARVAIRQPVLGRGPHVVEVQGASGRRFAGEFAVESLLPTRQPIRFALRPGR